ncbi:Endo-1,4-beta-xylanase A [bioreactor metagenome]|uniref:Endo-1,4-beta-xylanase A n=1 Tax=bioreactor metagenome TaxID=1076179 RepID=A0A644XXD9_9ZZZZ
MQDARYNAATGMVVFTTNHFSTYAVAYNKVSFADVASGAWYADAVTFLAARGITSGTTATAFGPDATLTRGHFITLLLRACGVAAVTNPADNFSDAGSTYYTGYLAAAKTLGITTGVGSNRFAPEQAITRQEMFTLLYNALKALDKLPSGTSGKTLADFTDASDIASWAQGTMAALVKAGTVTGSGGKLNPAGTTTRAEMAQVLYNLLGK